MKCNKVNMKYNEKAGPGLQALGFPRTGDNASHDPQAHVLPGQGASFMQIIN